MPARLRAHPAPPEPGKVVLVTGASRGIGGATANLLASRRWTVVGASRSGTSGPGWEGIGMDVDDDGSVQRGVRSTLDRHGRLDALVLAAGWGLAGPVETTTLAEARAQLETNFWGCVRVTKQGLPALRSSGGRIVILSSIGGQVAIPFQAYYSASKFALEGWAEALAYEVAPFGVHVTLIQPGNFRTDFTASRRESGAFAGPYAAANRRAIDTMIRDEQQGTDPGAVAVAIASQLVAQRPRRRVSVGNLDERAGLVAKRLLPHAWFEKLAKGSLGVG